MRVDPEGVEALDRRAREACAAEGFQEGRCPEASDLLKNKCLSPASPDYKVKLETSADFTLPLGKSVFSFRLVGFLLFFFA